VLEAKKNNNIVQLHSDKAMHAMRLMEARRQLESEPDKVKRAVLLAIWKYDADEYWERF